MAAVDVSAFVPRLLLERAVDGPCHWTDEGSAVFADIAGFTRLTDLLSQRGHEGAEDLTAALTRIFTVLLAASDDGGDLLKFSGDALTIYYSGPDHAARACHAAGLMQRVMKAVGTVRLSGARARLRMSTGIHSGTFHFFLVGRRQQHLVVAGRSVTTLLDLESVAAPERVRVSPQTADLVRPSWVRSSSDGGLELRRVDALPSVGSQVLFRAARTERVWRHMPAIFQARRDLLSSDPDHRHAAIGFLQVKGLDATLDAASPEALTRMVRLADEVESATEENGVHVLDTDIAADGYKYILAAGAPVGTEDPVGRMLRTLTRVTRADMGLALSAGASEGPVFAGPVGAPFRCTYTTMGDAVNLAARLCAHGSNGEVVVLAALLDRSLSRFVHTDVEWTTLKGKTEPVALVRVRQVLQDRKSRFSALPFVGREAELSRIEDAFDGVADGRVAVVEIVGEGGIGKSRLADVALSRLGLPVREIRADPYGALVPFQTLRGLLRTLLELPPGATASETGDRLAAALARSAPRLVSRLPLLEPVIGPGWTASETDDVEEIDERFRADATAAAVRDLLAALLPGPVALFFDDAQWIDEASAAALEVALTEVPDMPWAVVLARREEDSGLRGRERLRTTTIRPAALPENAARALVLEVSTELRPDELHAVVARGAGNPFFLLELARATHHRSLPDTVEELVGSRLDGLDGAERERLRTAAVLGTRFPLELYETVTDDRSIGDPDPASRLGEFIQVAPDGTVSFRRDIYRDVAYAQLAYRRRRHLHLKVADTLAHEPHLAGGAVLPMLSLHYHAAGLWEPAHRISVAAGHEARGSWANEEAVRFYRRAREAGQRLRIPARELRDLDEATGDVLEVMGRFGEAENAHRRCLRMTTDPPARLRLMLKIGRMLDHGGRFAAATRVYRQARLLAVPPYDDPVVLAEIDVSEASSRHLQGDNELGRDLALRAWERLRDAPTEQRAIRDRARAAFMHDTCAGFVSGPAGTRFGDLPLRMFEEVGDHYYAGIVANNLGIQAFESGRWRAAIEMYSRSAEHCRRAGDRVGEAIMEMNRGEVLGYQGHLDEAETLLTAAKQVFHSHEMPLWYADCCTYLAAVALSRGDTGDARLLLDEGARLHDSLGASHAADHGATKRLELLLAEGDVNGVFDAAEALLSRRRPLEPVHEARTRRALGAAHLHHGEPEEARVQLSEAMRLAQSVEAHHDEALAALLLADAGAPDGSALRRHASGLLRDLGITRLAG